MELTNYAINKDGKLIIFTMEVFGFHCCEVDDEITPDVID